MLLITHSSRFPIENVSRISEAGNKDIIFPDVSLGSLDNVIGQRKWFSVFVRGVIPVIWVIKRKKQQITPKNIATLVFSWHF